MYVTNSGNNTVSRANLDGTGGVSLGDLNGTLDVPMGIALDVTGGKMYIVNAGNSTISQANLDGSDGVSLGDLNGTLNGPRAIALDVVGGKMYVTNTTVNNISQANLDGTGGVSLGDLGGSGILNHSHGIALDVAGGKMYVVNKDNNTISQANLDGTGGISLGNLNGTLNSPQGIALSIRPDLEAVKTNNIGGAFTVGTAFNWTVTISNTDAVDAIFTNGQTIFKDDLPNGATTYGAPVVGNATNITNQANVDCNILGTTLTCMANGADVTIGALTGTFDVVFSVTPGAVGGLVNPPDPAGGDVCKVDPDGNVTEDDETNNDCADTVTAEADAAVAGDDGDDGGRSFAAGSSGGTYTHGPVGVIIPGNVLPEGSRLVTNQVSASAAGNFQLGSRVFDIKIYGPDGQLITSFDPPLKICIKPTNAELQAAGWNFNNLNMFHQHGGEPWGRVVNAYEENGSLCAEISQLSYFAIGIAQLPSTGFAPGMLHTVPEQPAKEAYTTYEGFWLEIPKLNLEMPIVGVPLTESGWDVTWLGESAGYLEGTAFPTWAGNTAITAHVWSADNTPGPFVDLHTLQHGDQFSIHAYGQIYIYEVRDTLRIRPNDLDVVFAHSDYDAVTLITCKGHNASSGEYDWRLVVRAVLMNIE